MNYMQFICKNQDCGRMFIAEDLYERKTPEKYRYCAECEANGFPVIRQDEKNKKMVRRELHSKI